MKKNIGITDKWIRVVIGIAIGVLFICRLGFQHEEANHKKQRATLFRRVLLKSITAGTSTLFIVPALFTSCEDESLDPDDNKDPNELTVDLTCRSQD